MLSVAIIMDPISQVKPWKDTGFRLALEAQARGYELYYLELADLFVSQGQAWASFRSLTVADRDQDFYELGEREVRLMGEMDLILMRKDPPFDTEFVYATHILELAERDGAKVVNRPGSLRDCSEKLYPAWFPHLIPPTLVSRNSGQLKAFHQQHGDIILKPLDGMGGASIFRVGADGQNLGVIIETLTAHGQRFAMAQKYLPEISQGDKRILLVNGEAVPYALARVPAAGETRGNLAAGGTGRPQPLTKADTRLAAEIGPAVKARGLYLVGLDVIGNQVTEINVTSPTCMRELENAYDLNIAGDFFAAVVADL